MISTCSWIMPNDEPCGELCEGSTPFCGSHNRQLRREKDTEKKEQDKRKALLQKAREKQQTPRKKVKPVSDKRKEENAVYSGLRRYFLIQNPNCQIRANQYCTGKATTIHHTAGRIGDKYLDMRKWKGACMSCHVCVESHPKEAKEKGWSESRLAINQEKVVI